MALTYYFSLHVTSHRKWFRNTFEIVITKDPNALFSEKSPTTSHKKVPALAHVIYLCELEIES